MDRVTGIGGVFFKAEDPKMLKNWYRKHLGVPVDGIFPWAGETDPKRPGKTVWAAFARDTKYFEPSKAAFMINYRVKDIDRLLEDLAREGVEIEKREDGEYGRFAWIMDPEGNRIELWEPPPE